MASRSELEEFLREEVKAARLKHELAVPEYRRTVAGQKKWPLPEPDGSTAIRNAGMRESAAFREYMYSLRVFTGNQAAALPCSCHGLILNSCLHSAEP